MNKETRQFLYGMLLLLVCGLGAAIHLSQIHEGVWVFDWFNSLCLVFCIYGTFAGISNILKTIRI